MRCGCDDMSVTFVFSDTQIAKEAFLEVMSSILSTGEVLDGPVGPEFERISCDVPNYNFVDSVTLIEAPSGESLAQVGSSLANNGDKLEARVGDCVRYTSSKSYRATKEQYADLEDPQAFELAVQLCCTRFRLKLLRRRRRCRSDSRASPD